ncbi:hypothetical protein AHAS_Ahas01G0270600 [Arachis hypogaea]
MIIIIINDNDLLVIIIVRDCYWIEFEIAEMEKKFKGKVAIVTASTQGIGFAIAERLGLEGASVVISSRKQQNVDEAAEKLRAKGIEVLALVCHVSNDQQRKDLIQKTAQVTLFYSFLSNALSFVKICLNAVEYAVEHYRSMER